VIGWGRRVKRTRKGDFELKLPADERELLRTVGPQLRELLDGDLADPDLRRLFPAAYPDDPEREQGYQALVRDHLGDRRRAAVDVLVATVDETRLDEEQLLAWMSSINDLRLVLGTRLDISEESELAAADDDPEAPLLALYAYLGFLLEAIVDALAD
jgi:uncharacterized protein DUF2017